MPIPRRPMHRRSDSSSSEASHASNASHRSHGSEDQFVLSPAHTPANEKAPPRVMVSGYTTDSSTPRDGLLLGKGMSLSSALPLVAGIVGCGTAQGPMLLAREIV